MGSHNLLFFGAQHPHWHSLPSPIDVGPPNPLLKRHSFSSSIDVGSHNPPLWGQRSRWHSFPSLIEVGPPNPPLFEASVLADTPPRVHPPSALNLLAGTSPSKGTHSLLQSMWDCPIHPCLGPNILDNTLSHVHPPSALNSLLAHHPVSSSDTICNSPNPPLVDIVFFGLFLSGFPSKFLKRVR